MGILSSKRNSQPSLTDVDPFDVLDESILEKSVFSKPNLSSRIKNKSVSTLPPTTFDQTRRGRSIKTYVFAAALVCLTGFAAARTKVWDLFSRQELVYAYFEVRALDAGGRPIAGAVVKNAGKRVGTTDSFGEWRRYMRVPLGSTVPITLAKKNSATELLFATKNFAVPLERNEKSEIELRGSVQLQITDLKNSVASNAVQTTPNDLARDGGLDTNFKGAQPSKAFSKDEVATAVSSDVAELKKSEVDSSAQARSTAHLAATNTTTTENPVTFQSSHESIWIESASPAAHMITRDVVPAMVQRAKELGLKVDPQSPWKVRVTNLVDRPAHVDKDGGGLVLVSSQDGFNGGTGREFLRNYQMDARATARGILFILSRHVNKNVLVKHEGQKWIATLPKNSSDLWKMTPGGTLATSGSVITLSEETVADGANVGFVIRNISNDVCANSMQNCEYKTRSYAEVSPMPNWTRLRMKAPSLGKDAVKIFVSGYEANLVGDKVYEYWGQNRARANVTVILNGRVVQRTQIFSDSGTIPTLAATTIGRR